MLQMLLVISLVHAIRPQDSRREVGMPVHAHEGTLTSLVELSSLDEKSERIACCPDS